MKTNKKGEVKIEFKAPDSLTSWNLWASAITKDLDFGVNTKEIESVKDLMVRSYFPRFFRQGDEIALKVVVNNAGKVKLSGKFHFELKDSKDASLDKAFELDEKFQIVHRWVTTFQANELADPWPYQSFHLISTSGGDVLFLGNRIYNSTSTKIHLVKLDQNKPDIW